MSGEVQIQGLSELLKNMRELPRAVEEKVLRAGVLAGAQLVKKAVVEMIVRRRTGLTAKAVRVAFNKKESTPGRKVYHVFVSQRVKMVYDPRTDRYKGKSISAFYWHMIELGTVKKGADPFMRPGFDTSTHAATSAITNKLAAGVEKEAARLGKS